MPINFVTGLPRHGKTLWTITTVLERAKREKRKVYYCNIPDVSIPDWEKIDHPNDWLTLDDSSIIIIDELQDFWGKAHASGTVPPPILELSKHGKRGFDFYFITQEPNLVHSTPRDLCQTHYYINRIFGTQNASVHKFDRLQLHPEKVKSKGEITPWSYPKEAFKYYKSADVHNIKRSIPKKVFAIPLIILFAVCCIFLAFYFIDSLTDKTAGGKKETDKKEATFKSNPKNQANEPISPKEYADSFVPRIAGLAYTAPRYDDLTTPINVPFPSACVLMEPRCQCYTDQATKLDIPPDLCRQFARNGIFNEFQEQPKTQNANNSSNTPLAGNLDNQNQWLPVTNPQNQKPYSIKL